MWVCLAYMCVGVGHVGMLELVSLPQSACLQFVCTLQFGASHRFTSLPYITNCGAAHHTLTLPHTTHTNCAAHHTY